MKKLLENKESGNWLVDVRIPTHSADLLWDKYIKEHSDELPQHFQCTDIYEADTEKVDTESDTGMLESISFLDISYKFTREINFISICLGFLSIIFFFCNGGLHLRNFRSRKSRNQCIYTLKFSKTLFYLLKHRCQRYFEYAR